MKLFNSKQVAEIDKYTIEHEPIASIDLMERAANQIADWIMSRLDSSFKMKVFVGPGNNGGDALVIARLLVEKGYKVDVYMIKIADKLSRDAQINLDRLKTQNKAGIHLISQKDGLPELSEFDIVIDGLFGSGLSRKLEGLAGDTVDHINKSETFVIAIDIPSGLFGEDNSENAEGFIVKADITLALQFPNLSFMFPENDEFVGELHIIPIGLHPDIIQNKYSPYFYIEEKEVQGKLVDRKKFAHKGNYGHALLISGSYGKMGAAILASTACLKTGVGLLTVHVPESGYQIMQTAIPEAMLSIDKNKACFSNLPEIKDFDFIGIGPGLGMNKESVTAMIKLFSGIDRPLVVDADGLNIIASNMEMLEKIPAGSIITPHPKEFERLFGKFADSYSRNIAQMGLSEKYKINIVLKGAYTCITTVKGECFFNSTGNPGMATAGSGDVLTGIILSLLSQGYKPSEAAIIGVYLHGLAGDIAASELSEEAMIASDINANIGNALKMIKAY